MSMLQVATEGTHLSSSGIYKIQFWIRWIVLLSLVTKINLPQASAYAKDAHEKVWDSRNLKETLVRSFLLF